MASIWNSDLYFVIFLLLGILLPVSSLWVLGPRLRPHKPSQAKQSSYESGVEPFGDAHVRYHARYYLFALLFVVFDVETVFFYPWAVASHQLGVFGLIEAVLFILFLAVGLIYAWRKKVLEWN
ncbi:NADH-quinone oxidoreductase subunit A [Alicyclobacillus tolerans]|uniref:NADH-quinone oxidoreductase subunit A n=2 Tax=Alicyclobacillus tolerans TaxID=90970 RepID=A0ABT9LU12_9BACL|nr:MULTISPECIES: NADH-quinone oxidoreductase subunit A [Alicyclobacillus]MDP9727754.1 NADH-quinone oxidoreductase subunit A [Alicyclobacillus tengchongensis]QRF24436.1 NADH-quinone oxidoreductase subunit A [Alicyclobacillus sp. TC]SHK54502.1 NADH dehydrogenase subunit A [Alicyclobacillus montanus]